MSKIAKLLCVSGLMFGAASGSALAADGDGDGRICPVTWQALRTAMITAKAANLGGYGNHMWGVVVNRTGVVCAVAFSGSVATDQWLLSRQIAAAKAFTANGLSLNSALGGSGQLSTAGLYPLVQPNTGPLYGVHFGNIQDASDATKGPARNWGTPVDPMIGRRIAGTITFGGGLALTQQAQSGAVVVGGLGISGDQACQDHNFARKVRQILTLDNDNSDDVGGC